MTAVIYARYSSDNQREESIEGQIRECTAYAERNTDRHLWRSDRSCIRGKWFGFGLHSCTTKKTAFDSCLFCFIRQFPFGSTGRTEDLNKAVTKRGALAELPGVAPRCTDPFKSFSALDNHPLFAVY